MKRIGILTSGGDAPGMNGAIRALVRSAKTYDIEVVGINRGFSGLINKDFIKLEDEDVSGILHKGGTIIKTARCPEFNTLEGMKKALENLQEENISCLVVIGGDGSLKGSYDFEKIGGRVVFLPGTIDNDMGYTDYTIGFSSAVNTVVRAINAIRETGEAHDKTTVVEVMGRHCGDIALNSGLSTGADLILLPEVEITHDEIAEKLRGSQNRNHSIIILSEGANTTVVDLEDIVRENFNQDIRKVVLSYLQRGGSPSFEDRKLASILAVEAIRTVYEDDYGVAIGISNNRVIRSSIESAVKRKKEVDLELLEITDDLR